MAAKAIKDSNRLWVILLLSIVGLLMIYEGTLSYPFLTHYDDGPLIQENVAVLNFDLKAIWTEYVFGLYHPVTSTLFAVEWQLFSGKASGFRWVSLIIHFINGILIFQLSNRLIFSSIISALIALIFILHPMHIESVVWMSEQKDLLYMLFFLLGIKFYLQYLNSEQYKWLVGCFAFFILSVLSKSAGVVFPIVLFTFLWYYQKISSKNVLLLLPFFLISVVVGWVNIEAQQQAEIITTYNFTVFERVLLFCYSLVYYPLSLIIPWDLSPKHFYPNFSEGIPVIYWLFLALTGGIMAPLFYVRKNKWILFSLLFYFVTIALVLKIITTGNDLVSDRYSYLPHLAILWILFHFLSKLKFKRLLGIVSIMGITYTAIGVAYVESWKSEIDLWSSVVKEYPKHPIGYAERGRNYLERKNYKLALKDLKQSNALDSSNKHVKNYLGLTYEAAENPEQAFKAYSRAIELDSTFAEAWNNRGVLLGKYGKLESSISDLKKSIELDKNNPDTYNNLGIAYAQSGDFETAEIYFKKCLEIHPNHRDAKSNLNRLSDSRP